MEVRNARSSVEELKRDPIKLFETTFLPIATDVMKVEAASNSDGNEG